MRTRHALDTRARWLVLLEHLSQCKLGCLACSVVWDLINEDYVICVYTHTQTPTHTRDGMLQERAHKQKVCFLHELAVLCGTNHM